MSIRFAAELPAQVPEALHVYRLAPPDSTQAAVARASQKFGLSGKMRDFGLTEDWTHYNENRFRVSVHRQSGALRYHHRDKYGVEAAKAFKLSDRESERAARGFLERTATVPLENAVLHRVTHLRSGSGDVHGKQREEKVLDAGVIYRRTVDDVVVEGPGGYAMVNIDPDQEVVGMRSVWRPTGKREAKVKLVRPEAATAAMEKLASRLQGDTTVTKAGFGYFEQGELDRQTFLEPAYFFIYAVQNGEVTHKSVEVIPAGQQTFARLKGSKRFSGKGQAPREATTQAAPKRGRKDT